MKIVTYNIHKCRGMDGRRSAQRIARVLAAIDADIIALQEVFSGHNDKQGQFQVIASVLGLESAFGRTRDHKGQAYGNGLLSRWPIIKTENMNLSWKRREKRGCLRADIETPQGPLHVFNIHMGTSYFERRHQVRSFLALPHVEQDIRGPRVLVGDFNEWSRGLSTRLLSEKFESLNMQLHIRRKKSYPGILPLLHLDHIYFERPLHIESAELVRTRLSKVASDHLPLSASFEWDQEE